MALEAETIPHGFRRTDSGDSGRCRGAGARRRQNSSAPAAREEARRQRLEELAHQAPLLRKELAESERRRDEIGERWAILEQEHRSLPSDASLREAHQRLVFISEQIGKQQERLARAEEERDRRRETVQEKTAKRNEAADDLQLPAEEDRLRQVTAALQDYRLRFEGFWPTLRTHRRILVQRHGARRDLVLLRERARESAQRARGSEEAARDAGVRLETLRSTVGESVAELERRLTANAERMKVLRIEQTRTQEKLLETSRPSR